MTRPRPHQQPLFRQSRTLLRDTVFDRIQAAILDGTLPPGQLLRNSDMESWLGVSRTPIREAFNQLQRIGLVEMQANRYTRVAVPRRGEALHNAQALGVLAVGALRLTMGRLDHQERAEITGAIHSVRVALEQRRMMDARNQALDIWKNLAARSGNRPLQRLLEDSGAEATFRLTPTVLNTALERDEASRWLELLEAAVSCSDSANAERAVEHLYHVPSQVHPDEHAESIPQPGETDEISARRRPPESGGGATGRRPASTPSRSHHPLDRATGAVTPPG